MPRQLIIKFHQDVQLHPDLPNIEAFGLTSSYFAETQSFHQLSSNKLILPAKTASDTRSFKLWTQWNDLINLLEKVKTQPRYLFRFNDVAAPTNLWKSSNANQQGNSKSVQLTVPNLYNYFRLDLPESLTDEEALAFLDQFEPFLPPQPQLKKKPFLILPAKPVLTLLEQAYLKADPDSLSSNSPVGMGNQDYLSNMKLNLRTEFGLNVGLTIIERDTWFVAHNQFRWPVNTNPPLIFPIPTAATPRIDWLNPSPTATTAPKHGTKILGVLKATVSGSSDLCQGLVAEAQYKMASCMAETTWYCEEGAVLEAVLQSQPGDVILIEVGTSAALFPLEVYPPIFELMQIAYQRDIIVIAAAGNQNAFLEPSSTLGAGSLPIRQVVVKAIKTHTKAQRKARQLFRVDFDAIQTRLTQFFVANGLQTTYNTPTEFANAYFTIDSHTILVGAADQITSTTAQKRFGSSWGSRVNVYAQGDSILTTTYNNDTTPSEYDSTDSTSGAAAIIAGMVVSLQSTARAQGRYVPPSLMKQWLLQGTRVFCNGSPIGWIPDYQTALGYLETWLTSNRNND